MSTDTAKPRRKRGPDKTGREVYSVRWDKAYGEWTISRRGALAAIGSDPNKGAAVKQATKEARTIGGLAQIRVFLKNGRFERETTIGRDPRRRKG